MRSPRRFFTHWGNILGLCLVLFFVVIAILAPVLSPEDLENPGPVKFVGRETDLAPHPPSAEAPLGTLPHQVSVYHSLIWGTRSALMFGFTVSIFAAFIGVVVGAVSAYSGGFLNNLLMRVTDAFLSFPVIAGVVLIHQLITNLLYNAGMRIYRLGSANPTVIMVSPEGSMDVPQVVPDFLQRLQQLDPILIAFILFSWMPYARMMNALVLNNMKTEYIEASRAMGAGSFRLIFRHLIPNSISPIFVLAARDVGGMVLLQATFTFIGMGDSSLWGMLLADGRSWIISPGGILTYWWVFVPATVALILFGIGWNLLGDGLNEALNPRNT